MNIVLIAETGILDPIYKTGDEEKFKLMFSRAAEEISQDLESGNWSVELRPDLERLLAVAKKYS